MDKTKKKRGRNPELICKRNPVIVARYYYWYYVKYRRDALSILANSEFFLSEVTLENIIYTENDLLNRYISLPKEVGVKLLRKKFPSFSWRCSKEELVNS